MATKINAAKLRTKLKAKLKKAGSEPFSYKYNEGIGAALEIIENMNREAIDKKIRKSLNHSDKPHKITEVCTFCENAVTLVWDTKHDGYEIYCPCCGKRMTLKDAYYREVTAKEQEDVDNKKFQPKEGEDCVY